MGLPATGMRGLGTVRVCGRKRVPRPAMGIMIFIVECLDGWTLDYCTLEAGTWSNIYHQTVQRPIVKRARTVLGRLLAGAAKPAGPSRRSGQVGGFCPFNAFVAGDHQLGDPLSR